MDRIIFRIYWDITNEKVLNIRLNLLGITKQLSSKITNKQLALYIYKILPIFTYDID